MLKNIVSVDIGSSLIKLAQLSQIGSRIRLDKVAVVNNPIPRLGTASEITKKDAIVQIIKRSLKENHVKAKDTVSSLAGSSLIIQYFKFPLLSEKDLESTVRLEAERIMSDRLARMDTDFQALSPYQEKKKEENILFASIPRVIVGHRLNILREAGLNPVAIDIDSMALANCFLRLKNTASQESVMVLNLGARLVNLVILNKGSLHFLRDITLDLETPFDLKDKKVLEKTVEEICRSIHYYEARERKNKVGKIFFTGGAAAAPGITDSFSKALGLPVEEWNPLKDVEYPSGLAENKGYLLAVAIGLGLREE